MTAIPMRSSAKLVWSLTRRGNLRYLRFAPPGHHSSPLPDARTITRDADRLFDQSPRDIPGIDLRKEAQLALLSELAGFYGEQPFASDASGGLRYRFRNGWFDSCDAIVLYGLLRRFRPKRVIEVGSGWSSALMLDVNERFLDGATEFTFVEPQPFRLRSLLRDGEQEDRIISTSVQDVPLDRFRRLAAGDFLFVDSSHVSKIGSNVNYLLFEVLPILQPGVIVHFHDIAWPFEYPREWLEEGRAFNEAYTLRAFLQFNDSFDILYFNAFVNEVARATVREKMPLCLESRGSSIWIRKTRGRPRSGAATPPNR